MNWYKKAESDPSVQRDLNPLSFLKYWHTNGPVESDPPVHKEYWISQFYKNYGTFYVFNRYYSMYKKYPIIQKLREEIKKYLFDMIKEYPNSYYNIRENPSFTNMDSDLKNDFMEIIKQLGIDPINQESLKKWIKDIESDYNKYNNCPYKDLEEIKKARIRGAMNEIKKDLYYIKFFPDELKDLPEIQNLFFEEYQRLVNGINGDGWISEMFNKIYREIKSTSLGKKLRRELVKSLFHKIKENHNFYYDMRIKNLDPDIRNDLETISKHLKLPVASPKGQQS